MGSLSSSVADFPEEVDESWLRRVFFANKEELEAAGIDLEKVLGVQAASAHLRSKHTKTRRDKIMKKLAAACPEIALPLMDIHGITDSTLTTHIPGSALKAARKLRENDLKRRQEMQYEYTSKESLLRIVEKGTVRLLRPQFLMKWCANGAETGPIPHRLELERLEAMLNEPGEEEIFLDVETLNSEERKRVEIIAVSCSRLGGDDNYHPDPEGFHLETIDRLLRSFLFGTLSTTSVTDAHERHQRGFRFGAGDDRPVGIFWDWCSIYHIDDIRGAPEKAPEQKAAANEALEKIPLWYANTSTIVWLLHYMPPTYKKNNQPIYVDDGWRTFERHVAAISTKSCDLLDINIEFRSMVVDKAFAAEPTEFVMGKDQFGGKKEKPIRDKRTGKLVETDAHMEWRRVTTITDSYFNGNYMQLCIDTMVHERHLPLTPEQFNAIIDEEMEASGRRECHWAIKDSYRQAFNALFGRAPQVSLPDFGLTDAGIRPTLQVMQVECPHLQNLNLSGNQLTVATGEFSVALSGLSLLQSLNLSNTGIPGNIADLSHLRKLEFLHLNNNKFLYGRIGSLSHLKDLKEVGLRQCFKLDGDIVELVSLQHLKKLDLGFCQKIVGDVSHLSHLTGLKDLHLTGRGITGDITGVKVLYYLENLDLNYTRVGGELGCLTSLQNLHSLCIQFTGIKGNIKTLSHMEHLQELRMCGTKISGDVRQLNKLENLRHIDMNQCSKIKGDVRRLCSLEHIRTLQLGGTEVEGDVKDLATLLMLEDINVHKTKVVGGPRAIKRLLGSLRSKRGHSSNDGPLTPLAVKGPFLPQLSEAW